MRMMCVWLEMIIIFIELWFFFTRSHFCAVLTIRFGICRWNNFELTTHKYYFFVSYLWALMYTITMNFIEKTFYSDSNHKFHGLPIHVKCSKIIEKVNYLVYKENFMISSRLKKYNRKFIGFEMIWQWRNNDLFQPVFAPTIQHFLVNWFLFYWKLQSLIL